MYAATIAADAERNYLECAPGNDKMYAVCMQTCNQFYAEIKAKIDHNLDTKKKLAHTKQEVKDFQLKNLMLEENIDEMLDQ